MTTGRRRATSAKAIEVVAIRLFTDLGFDHTTIDQIAEAAGVNRRTFFRHFPNKDAVLWTSFEQEMERLRSSVDAAPDGEPIISALRGATLAADCYRAEDVPAWRTRKTLFSSNATLRASALVRMAEWEDAVAACVARRTDRQSTDLLPRAVGRAICGVFRAAFDEWLACADADLAHYIDEAIAALATGFPLGTATATQ